MKRLLTFFSLLLFSLSSFGQTSSEPQRPLYATRSQMQSGPIKSDYFIGVDPTNLRFQLWYVDKTSTAPASSRVIVRTNGWRIKMMTLDTLASPGVSTYLDSLPFSRIKLRPTTLSGYGITNGVSTGGSYSNPAWIVNLNFGKLVGLPTTLAGYGITDAISTSGSYSNPSWITSLAYSKLTLRPTTLDGYGITDAITAAAATTELNKRIPYRTVSQLKAFTAGDVANMPRVFITDAGREGEFRYVPSSTASDNVGTVIVTTSGGYRYQRVFQGDVYAGWFRNPSDAAGATQDRNAINAAVQYALAQTIIPTVVINQGVWKVDNAAIYCNVPLNKTLKIRGEGNPTIDFLATGADDSGQDAVFRTANSWTWPGQSTAKVFGTISGDTLNVTYVKSGTLKVGQLIYSNRIKSGTNITELLSGSGTTGTYRINRIQTASADTVYVNAATLGWTNGDRSILYGSIDIRGLKFYGGRSTTVNGSISGYSRPLLFRQCQSVTIEFNQFENIIGSGGAIGVCDAGSICYNTFFSVYARETYYDRTGDAFSVFGYSQNVKVNNNTIVLDSLQSGRCGISIDDYSRNCTVNGNTIVAYERGIHVETSEAVTVSDNAIRESPVGILTAQNTGGVIVSDNTIDATNVLVPSTLGYTAHLFAFEDFGTSFYNNTIRGGLQTENSRYIAKFWGRNLSVTNNKFLNEKNEKFVITANNRVTSTTSNSIPANLNTPVSKTFTYSSNPNLVWKVKQRLRAFTSTYVYVEGYITSVSSTSVTIQLDGFNGSGTYSSWTIQYVDMGVVMADGAYYSEFSGNTFNWADLSANSSVGVVAERNTFKSSYCVGQSSNRIRIAYNKFIPAEKETLAKGVNVYGATKPFAIGNEFTDVADYVFQQDATSGTGRFYSNIYTRTNANAAGLDYFYTNTGYSATGSQKMPASQRNTIVDELGNENYYVGNTGTKVAN